MVTVTLHCDDCGARAVADYVHSIDVYDYHDAPTDGITFVEPAKWWFSAQGYRQSKDLAALCPKHNTKERRDEVRGW